ncbi:MAG TPA: CAP domain-containing protein [Longimicrobium sp.]|nr:CAP domain-containing protein [Longimicrobium sp.]
MNIRILPIALTLSLTTACVPVRDAGEAEATGFAEQERELHALVNRHRAELGLSPLAYDPRIADVARAHSQAMARGVQPFGHARFPARLALLRQRVGAKAAAENLAANNAPPDRSSLQAFRGLLASPEHRRTMESAYDRTGVGVARSATGEFFHTQIFVR